MTEYKRLSYKLEDAIYLGKSIPIVVLRQTLPTLAKLFDALPDIPDYIPGTQHAISKMITDFIDEQSHFADDECELKERFVKADKFNKLGHHLLSLFENGSCPTKTT